MSITDQLMAAVQASNSDAGEKAVALEFLRTAGPIVETLGPSVFQEVLRSAAAGLVPATIVGNLNAGQIATLLAQVDLDLYSLVQKHAAERAAWDAAMTQLQAAALSAVARVVIGII